MRIRCAHHTTACLVPSVSWYSNLKISVIFVFWYLLNAGNPCTGRVGYLTQQYKAFAICVHGLTESPGILNRRRDCDPIAHESLSVLILHLRADTNYVVPLFQALKLPMLRRLQVQVDNPQETMHDWYRYSRTIVDNLCSNSFVQLLRQSCMEEVSIWNAPLCEKDMKYLATTHQTAMRRYHKDGVTEGIYTISNGPKPR